MRGKNGKNVKTNKFLWSTVLNSGFVSCLEVFVAVITFLLKSFAQQCLTLYQELVGSTAETCPRLAFILAPSSGSIYFVCSQKPLSARCFLFLKRNMYLYSERISFFIQ